MDVEQVGAKAQDILRCSQGTEAITILSARNNQHAPQ